MVGTGQTRPVNSERSRSVVSISAAGDHEPYTSRYLTAFDLAGQMFSQKVLWRLPHEAD